MKKSFKGRLDLKFFPSAAFEEIGNMAPAQKNPVIARNALRLLMMGASKDWAELISLDTFYATFFYHDSIILKELRFAFQQGFEFLYEQLKNKDFNQDEEEQFRLYISNCLDLLPYSDLSGYESIKVPKIINKKCELVEYGIQPIELTPTTGFKKWFLQDHDRVFAYGLEAINHPTAQSHLIFMGTTYPAGQGFWTQIVADLKGFETVGKSLYKSGKERLTAWLKSQKMKVEIEGLSLGASLALQIAIDQGEYIECVYALNPAGLHDSLYKSEYDKWDQLIEKPRVVVQKQGDDPVSAFGIWKKEWEIIQVLPPQCKRGSNIFFDHFLNYAGFAETEFTYVDPEEENLKRKLRNFWIYSVGRGFVYYVAAVPYFYVFRPMGYFIAQHWLSITLAAISLIATSTAIALATHGSIFALITSSVIAFLSASACIIHEVSNRSIPSKLYVKIHDPALPRNPAMDIYNNKVQIDLSDGQITTYSRVMGLINDQPVSPVHRVAPGGIEMSKAKARLIKRVLTTVEQLGEAGAVEAVAVDYRQYTLGKYP